MVESNHIHRSHDFLLGTISSSPKAGTEGLEPSSSALTVQRIAHLPHASIGACERNRTPMCRIKSPLPYQLATQA